MELLGNVALVTGAGKGIGKAIAEALVANGIKVGVNALHAGSAESATAALIAVGGQAMALPADVAEQQAVDGMVAELTDAFGPVDVLVNNAAANGGIDTFTKALAGEVGQYGITVNSVSPGAILDVDGGFSGYEPLHATGRE